MSEDDEIGDYNISSLRWLLRFARKNEGQWSEGNVPDEDDARLILELLVEFENKQKAE